MPKIAKFGIEGNISMFVLIEMWEKIEMRRDDVIARAATKFSFSVNFVKMMRSFVTIGESFVANMTYYFLAKSPG